MEQLLFEMRETLDIINGQIDEASNRAKSQGINPFAMRYHSGEYVLVPLLVAKAELLVAIAKLERES